MIINSCAPITHYRINEDIRKVNLTNLEATLAELESRNAISKNAKIDKIKKFLAQHYLLVGNNHLTWGHFEGAIKYLGYAVEYNPSISNRDRLEFIIGRKEYIDEVVSYICSNDSVNYLEYISKLDRINRTSSPISESAYLRKQISSDVIDGHIMNYQILTNRETSDIEKYVSLLQESSKFNLNSQSSCMNFLGLRYQQLANQYRQPFYDENFYENISNRIEWLKVLDTIGDKHLIPDEELKVVRKFLAKYYDDYHLNNNPRVKYLYEIFLANEILGFGFQLEESIQTLMQNHSYHTVFKKSTEKISSEITNLLSNSVNVSKVPNESIGKNIQIEISVDTLWTQINPNAYVNNISSKYLIGTHLEPNPSYNIAANRVVAASSEYQRISAQPVPAGGAVAGALHGVTVALYRNNLVDAKATLLATPTTIEVEDYQYYTFKEIGNTIMGLLDVSILVTVGNNPTFSIPVITTINTKAKSLQGVVPNDFNGYSSSTSLVPTDIILESILIKNIIKDIQEQIAYDKLSVHLPEIIVTSNTIKRQVPNYKSKEFLSLFDKYFIESSEDEANNIKLNRTSRNFTKLKDVINYAANASCQVIAYDDDYSSGAGTAYFISENGFLVTNSHVVEGKSNFILLREINNTVEIKFADLMYSDNLVDLALLKTYSPFKGSTTIILNNNSNSEMGDEIIYVGYPGTPIAQGSEPFTSRGIVSQIVSSTSHIPTLILFDITANPGASGSAVINEHTGELIGTLTWGFGRSINVNDLVNMIGGQHVQIKESQNVGTSANVLLDFLKNSGFQD